MKKILCIAVFCCFLFPISLRAEMVNPVQDMIQDFFSKGGEKFPQVWNKISSITDTVGDLSTKEDRNEKNLIQEFFNMDTRYGKILKEARDVLSLGEASVLLDKIDKLQEQNKKLKEKISQLKRERIMAPTESVVLFVQTKADIDKETEEIIPREIHANNKAIDELKTEVCAVFKKNGIRVTKEQIDYFLVSAEGDELLKLMSMAQNMKMIQKTIETQLREEKKNRELAKLYAGIHLVSLDAYDMAHTIAIENLEGYKKKLTPIVEEANRTISEAKMLMQRADPSERQILESNMRISMRVISVANSYAKILTKHIAKLKTSQAKVTYKAGIARNSYSTVINGDGLISLIQKSQNEYEIIMNFSVPELETLYEPAMMDTLAEISARLKE